MKDPLVEHYKNLVVVLESIVVSRAPRFMKPKGLTDPEIEMLALLLAGGHDIDHRRV